MTQINEDSVVAFEALGTGAVVAISPEALAERVRQCLPPCARERRTRPGDAAFALDTNPGDGYRVASPGQKEPFHARDVDEAIDRLRTELVEHVALHAPDHVFVRGGAVAMGGRAIVLPGEPEAGTSALVAALVGAGATHCADGYVPIDAAGRVHPLAVEGPRGSAPVALIAMLTAREGGRLALHDRTADDAVLALLNHTQGADERPEFGLRAARAAAKQALVLVGECDRSEEAAAALIERLSRLPPDGPQPQRALPPKMQFVSLVLELEGELAELARKLEAAGVHAALLNGDEVRTALAHGFAFAFAAEIEVAPDQVPRTLGTMESAGWQRMRSAGQARYFRRGVIVRVTRRRGSNRTSITKGRLGFAEPGAKVAGGAPKESLGPMPFAPPGSRQGGLIGAARQCAAEAATALDTFRLRTRERDFHGLPMQHGPGAFGFETIAEQHVDAILDRLPSKGTSIRFVEVGTATGVVALSVARERPDVEVLATDVSFRALGWARRNRRRLGVRNVRFAQGSLLAPVRASWRGRVAAIAANLPLALPAMSVELSGVVGWPVGTATGPGADGLGLIRALARDARHVLQPGGHLHLQLQGQHGPWLAPYLDELGYEAEIPADAAKLGTIELAARWPGPTRS